MAIFKFSLTLSLHNNLKNKINKNETGINNPKTLEDVDKAENIEKINNALTVFLFK